MIINKKNGRMTFGTLIIRPRMKYSDVNRMISDDEILSCETGNCIDLLLKPRQCYFGFFLIRMIFDISGEELEICHISVQKNSDVPSWENWSQEAQMRKKEENEKWLLKEIGITKGAFKWGKVRSIYNALEASSYIVFEY